MFSVPAADFVVRAPAALTAIAASAAAARSTASTRFFRPSMYPSKEEINSDWSSLWQRNHTPVRSSTCFFRGVHLTFRACGAADDELRLQHLHGASARRIVEPAEKEKRRPATHLVCRLLLEKKKKHDKHKPPRSERHKGTRNTRRRVKRRGLRRCPTTSRTSGASGIWRAHVL